MLIYALAERRGPARHDRSVGGWRGDSAGVEWSASSRCPDPRVEPPHKDISLRPLPCRALGQEPIPIQIRTAEGNNGSYRANWDQQRHRIREEHYYCLTRILT